MNRCPACGKVYGDEARFCTRDGSKLIAMPASPGRGTVAGRAERPAELTHANLTDRVLDGRYKIVRKVGEGGMSFVYLASDIATHEQYAIKVLSAALSSDANAMARLRREASLGMRLAHPNVCHIIRLGETQDGLVYVVMPYVEGEVLSDRNNRLGTLQIAEVVRHVQDIAAGLQVAHELKIVHRDLKPENVMICKQPGGAERAVVMDFGLAKQRRAGAGVAKLTQTGIVLGTPEFMSPEQIRGKPLDGRSDVYAVAVLAFEMFTSQLPFSGRNAQETMIARLKSTPTPIRQLRPDLPARLEALIARSLSLQPADRPASMDELAFGFEAVLHGGVMSRLFGR
jgi:eukaryotic-like serine/threonine-protein kinase